MLRDRLRLGLSIGLLGLLPFVLPGISGALFFLLFATVFTGLVLSELFELQGHLGFSAYARFSVWFGMVWILAAGLMMHFFDGQAPLFDALWQVLPGLFLLALLLPALRETDRREGASRLLASLAGLLFVLATLGLLPRVYFWNGLAVSGRMITLYLILTTKLTDVGAYAVGSLTARRKSGNHRMMPNLSPGKSWEGLAGGLAVGIVVAIVFDGPRQALFGGHGQGVELLQAVGFGVFCTMVGLFGDMTASLLKRAARIKHSGRIPGLGGAIDMLDSLFFVTPLFYIFLYLRHGV